MLVCYLDDSDSEQSSVATLAGYVQHAEDWEAFEIHAEEVYKKYDVSVLHATDLQGTRGCFKGWKYADKRDFIDDLFRGSDRLSGISHSVHKSKFRALQPEIRWAQQSSTYGYALEATIGGFINNTIPDLNIKSVGLSLVIESGNRNSELEIAFNKARDSSFGKDLHSLEFSGKEGSRAIQLADLFAFYSRRHASKIIQLRRKTEKACREKEEKFFSLITSKAARNIVAMLSDPLGGEMVPLKEYQAKLAAGAVPGTHVFTRGRRPEDPTATKP